MDRQVPDRPATPTDPAAGRAEPAAGQVVFGNRWDQLSVPELGAWTPTRRISVVLPHYQAPDALDITLAALSAQSYPAELIQIVVADDGSTPPLELAADHRGLGVTVVSQEDRGFRLAAVRNLGAEAADGDVLVFLDHDMVPEPRHLEAHARWHHACQHAVTLGFRRHVAFDGIGPDEVLAAARAGSLAPLFADRPVSEPAWLERHMDRMAELTADHDDLFRATTGGNLGIRAETFHAVGGFDATFTQWGSEDTDLGHRLFLAGALLVPERAAACWHQGDSRGLEPHERASLDDQHARISQEVAHLGFRRVAPGRSFRIPRLLITVRIADEPHATITATLESVLASHLHDLEVLLVVPEDHPDRTRVLREWAGDPRVIEHERDAHDRTPYRMELPVGAALAPETLHGLLAAMTDPSVPTGVLHVPLAGAPTVGGSASAEAPDAESASAEALVVSQRALARARMIGAADELRSAGELFGRRTLAGENLGVRWAPVTELTRVPRPALPRPAGGADRDAGSAAATSSDVPTGSGATAGASPREPSRAGSWLLVDTPLGWLTRGTARELFADADRRVTAAEQAAATARHEAAVARYERDRVANRKAVRLATEVADTAGGRSVRSLPTRLRAAADPLPRATDPGPAAEVVAPTTVARDRARGLDERGLLPPRPVRPAPFPHLRVLHLGAAGRFLHLADHTTVAPDTWRDQLSAGADVLLIEPPAEAPGWDPLGGELPTLLRAARELGIPSVRLAVPSSRGGPGAPALELVEGAPGGADTVAPSVDTSVLNPTGWRHQPPDPVVAVLDRAPDGTGRDLLAAFDPPVVLVHPNDLPSIGDEFGIQRSVSSPAGLRRSLIRAGVLLDHASWRGDATERLRTWTAALACGTPVVVVGDEPDQLGTGGLTLADGTRVTLPPGVIVTSADEAVETVHRLLIDVDLRERHGIVGRRWALRAGSRETVLREILGHLDVPAPAPPRTTVLLATNRPDFLERGLANVARQSQAGVDVSLVLHGSAFDGVDLPDRDGLVTSVVRAPDRWLLGDCLNVALDQAQGELIAKMDDDDHYGPEHLSDLVTAWHYSGADIVGKRIEYIHLAERGITVRRPSSRPERDRPHVGGPTLFGSRDTLRRHRFLRVPNRVDSTLYERVIADGGRVYGIHSRDLVLERHGHGHAWTAADEDFLADAIDQRDGLALDLATSDPVTGT